MEKYGCNRKEEIVERIRELEGIIIKTAAEADELIDLRQALAEIYAEEN